MFNRHGWLLSVCAGMVVTALACLTNHAKAASPYLEITEYEGMSIEGVFNVVDGYAHYWNAPSSWSPNGGYHILNTSTGQIADIGYAASVSTNGFGDPFGIYDGDTGTFYAATYYNGSESYLYSYKTSTGQWTAEGAAINLYGADTYNGELYISGLREPWTGGFGSTYISLFDFSENHQHDALIEVGGASADVAVDKYGNVYYATYGDYGVDGVLRRYDAALVQSHINDLANGETDTYVPLTEGTILTTLPAGGNGIVVDDSGAVFFTINNWSDPTQSGVLRWDESLGMGEEEHFELVLSAVDAEAMGLSTNWFGSLSIEGSFDNGAPLYASLGWAGPIYAIAIPEPASLMLLAAGAACLVTRRRRQF